MSDPTLLPMDEEIIVEPADSPTLGDTCATCAHFQREGAVPGQDDGWGECTRVGQPGALFEIEGGGTLWVEQGYYCSQYEAAGEEDEMVVIDG